MPAGVSRFELTSRKQSVPQAGLRLWLVCLVVLFCLTPGRPSWAEADREIKNNLRRAIEDLSAHGDRGTGTEGCRAAADYIFDRFNELGLKEVDRHRYALPLVAHHGSRLTVSRGGKSFPVRPFMGNALAPGAIGPEPLEGPLVWGGSGDLKELNGKPIQGAVVLMDMDSGQGWMNVASLGAEALIYVDRGHSTRWLFNEKFELTPIDFPRFWMPYEEAREHFGDFESPAGEPVIAEVRLESKRAWQETEAENIYGLIEGTDPDLKDELIVIEAFYDSTATVSGASPGADEALGAAALLELARLLVEKPPARSVLLAATSGHAQTLSGMRELIWSLATSSRQMRKSEQAYEELADKRSESIELLRRFLEAEDRPPAEFPGVIEAVSEYIKSEVDAVSRELMRLRLEQKEENRDLIKKLADRRLLLRRLGWGTDPGALDGQAESLLRELARPALESHERVLQSVRKSRQMLRSARNFRQLTGGFDIACIVSLHLSSHGDGVGAFNQGWLYKPETGNQPGGGLSQY